MFYDVLGSYGAFPGVSWAMSHDVLGILGAFLREVRMKSEVRRRGLETKSGVLEGYAQISVKSVDDFE